MSVVSTYGLTFDATSGQFVTMGNVLDFTAGPFSLACWFKTSDTSQGTFYIAGKGAVGGATSGYAFAIYSTGIVEFQVREASDISYVDSLAGNDFRGGIWHHVVGVRTAGGVTKFYVNGRLQGSESTSLTSITTATSFAVGANGADGSGFTQPFPGSVDDVRVYDAELSASQVFSLYAGINVTTNLQGYWKFDEGSGTTATDSSGNGYTGTLTNGPTYTSAVSQNLLYSNLVASAGKAGDTNNATTDAVDTTGASLLVVEAAVYYTTPSYTVSDSKSNTWTPLTSKTDGTVISNLWYVVNPTVGSGHTFTVGTGSGYPAICMMAFSGIDTSSPFDVENGNNGGSLPIATGSVTPSVNNEIVVAGMGFYTTGIITINNSFTNVYINYAAGTNFGSSLAYIAQTTASAVNPTFSSTTGSAGSDGIAAFKPAGAPPAGSFVFIGSFM